MWYFFTHFTEALDHPFNLRHKGILVGFLIQQNEYVSFAGCPLSCPIARTFVDSLPLGYTSLLSFACPFQTSIRTKLALFALEDQAGDFFSLVFSGQVFAQKTQVLFFQTSVVRRRTLSFRGILWGRHFALTAPGTNGDSFFCLADTKNHYHRQIQ